MSDAITSTKLEQTGEIFWDSRDCLSCVGICVFSPGHESEMRGYLVYLLIVKYRSNLVKIQPEFIRLDGLFMEFFFFGGGDLKKKEKGGGVCRSYHLQGLYGESEFIYLP